MGEKTLVEIDIDETIQLTQKLDQLGQPPSFVCWYYYDDADEWRLLLAGPSLDKLLPAKEALAYRTLVEALATLGPSSLSASDIKIIATTSPLAKALRMLVRTGPTAIVRAHFTNLTLSGLFIKEALIIRAA